MAKSTKSVERAENPIVRPLAYDIETFARISGLGRTKIYDLFATGELPSFKVGRRRLIRAETADALFRRLEQQTDDPQSE